MRTSKNGPSGWLSWMLGAALLALAVPQTASAALVTIAFQGTVSSVDNGLPFTSGDTLSGSFTFDNATPADAGSNVSVASYTASNTSTHFTVGSYSNTGSTFLRIVINNSDANFFDAYTVFADTSGPPTSGGASLTGFQLALFDSTFQVFSDNTLPAGAPPLTGFDDKGFSIGFVDPDTQAILVVRGTISSLTAVPIPATVMLMGPALAGLVRFRRTRRTS